MPSGTQEVIEGLLCLDCADVLVEDRQSSIEGVCESCYDENVTYCEGCGDSYLNNWNRRRRDVYNLPYIEFHETSDNEQFLCGNCVYICQDCGEAFAYEDFECCRPDRSIYYYSYIPPNWKYWDVDPSMDNASYTIRPQMYPSKLFMGIELEVEKVKGHMVEGFLTLANEEVNGVPKFCYFKEDGSLSEYGAELVTMPATLDGFKFMFPFNALKWLREEGARSFYYSSCGFHIHVSRSAFSPSHLYKFLKFHDKNDKMCQVVGQREYSSYASWDTDASFNFRKNTKNVAKCPDFGNRYSAINTNNSHTVELRYFKGNILEEAVLKNVEFVDSVYEYTKQLTIPKLWQYGYSWDMYIEYLVENKVRYPNLVKFLSEPSSDNTEG